MTNSEPRSIPAKNDGRGNLMSIMETSRVVMAAAGSS